MPGKTIAVLGGGVGGVVTANELRKRLGREHRVVLIEKERDHVFWPSLLWLQVGMREPEKIVRPLALLEKKGIEVINEEITAIHPDRKAVNWEGGELESDYLIVSLGAQLAPEQIPGLSEAGHNLYTVAGATEIRDARQDFTHGNLVVLVARTPFKCPAAPYEGAMLLEHDLRKRKVRDQISIGLYSPEPGPMGVTGAENSAKVRQLVESRNISYFPQHVIAEVDAKNKTLHFENGVEAAFDFLVYIPPHIAPPVVSEAGLTGESDWVPVDRHTLETKFADVYAIGDVTGIPLAVGLPLPKAGVFAHHQAVAVAQSIAADITGTGQRGTFSGGGECFIEIGGGKAGIGRGNFYHEPNPAIKMHKPGWHWHVAKVLFEKRWLRKWF